MPLPKPRSYARPAQPESEDSLPVPTPVPTVEPVMTDADWAVLPGLDAARDPAEQRDRLPQGRYEAPMAALPQ
jgi:hypothetical protein